MTLSGGGREFRTELVLPRSPSSTQGDPPLQVLRLLPLARAGLCQCDHARGLSPAHREANLQRAVRSGLQEGRHRKLLLLLLLLLLLREAFIKLLFWGRPGGSGG